MTNRKSKNRTSRNIGYEQLELRNLLAGVFGSVDLGIGNGADDDLKPTVLNSQESSEPFPAFNLAKFQKATASSSASGISPNEAVDGIVNNDSRWYSSGSGPHWLQVELSATYPVGSAQLFLGKDNSFTVGAFEIQYLNDGSWETAVSVTGNSATDLNLVFPQVIEADTFRFYTEASLARVKEFVLLPPNDGEPFPLGTDVDLNLVDERGPVASSVYQSNYAIKAVDGWVADNSRWLVPNNSGPHTIELEIPSEHLVGSVHLYSGFDQNGVTQGVLSSFGIEYLDGGTWTPIPGGTVSSGTISGNTISGNSSDQVVVNFSSPVSTTKVRLTHSSSFGRIREVVVLPANVADSGETGYPIGASVKFASRPNTNFKDFHDSWYRIAARSNGNSLIATTDGASQADPSTSNEAKYFQLMYVKAMDAYRIRNQDSGKGLEVEGASREAGANIVEGEYSASPHQLWRLEPTSGGYYQFVNLWSGLTIQTDGGSPATVTQQEFDDSGNPDSKQQWSPIFQDDYFKKGTGGWVGQYGTGWAYDWARNDKDNLPTDQFYTPMQHREGWPNLGTLHRKYHDWNNDIKPAYLLGFNEPDRPDQANMSVARAVELWPRLMAMDVPLVSPANALGGEDWWLQNFADQIDGRGYRMEYSGGHWYSGPSVNNLFAHIDDVQSRSNGRPVWLTEFSVVDWSGGSGNWSEESNYNFILEFLWRAESKANLEKYAVFLFSGNSPANPWTMSNPRSNFFSNGSLTPFGKAYAAWDGVTSIQTDQPYVIHNRNARHRLRNDGATTEPTPSWIRREDASVQWMLRDAGGGKRYIQSGNDGRLLRWDGTTLDYAPAGTTGAEVEWTIPREQYGWHNIISEVDGKYLRLVRVNNSSNAPVSQTFEMVTAAQASGYSSTDWWFVNPYQPVADVGEIVDVDATDDLVVENVEIGTPIGITANASDPDGQEVSYSLSNDAGGMFSVDSVTGVVTVAGALDFETSSFHVIELKATSEDGSSSFAEFLVTVQNAPEVTLVDVGNGIQRSKIDHLTLTFDGEIEIGSTAFNLIQRSDFTGQTGTTIGTQFTTQLNASGQTVVMLTFTNGTGPSGQLLDGNYQLTIDGSQVTYQGSTTTMQSDFVFGDDESDKFFALFGDVNGDRTVNVIDLFALRTAYRSSEGDDNFNALLDYNGDGRINVIDLFAFRTNYRKRLSFS